MNIAIQFWWENRFKSQYSHVDSFIPYWIQFNLYVTMSAVGSNFTAFGVVIFSESIDFCLYFLLSRRTIKKIRLYPRKIHVFNAYLSQTMMSNHLQIYLKRKRRNREKRMKDVRLWFYSNLFVSSQFNHLNRHYSQNNCILIVSILLNWVFFSCSKHIFPFKFIVISSLSLNLSIP